MSICYVKKLRGKWSAIPDDILEDQSHSKRPYLSPAARLALAWMIGRPDGWEIHIKHMLGRLGISELIWRRVRKELIAAGFFRQIKRQDPHNKGKLIWVHEVGDEPIFHSSIPIKPMPRFSTHGEPEDIPESF